MPNLLVIVHNAFDAKMLSAFFNKNVPNIQLRTLPIPEKGSQIDHLTQQILLDDMPHVPDVIIVESNYGTPSSPCANDKLLRGLLEKFPQALIVAHGSTMESLSAAMKVSDKIKIMGKGNINPPGCQGSKIHSLTTLKNLLTEDLANTCSPKLTFAYDLSIAFSELPLNSAIEGPLTSNSAVRPL